MPWKNETRVAQRSQLVQKILREEVSIAEGCRRFGVSGPTAYKYLQRFQTEGRKGLMDRKRGPGKQGKGARKWIARLLRQRARHPTWGGRKLLWQLRQLYPRQRPPSERTLDRWLRKQGLTRRRTHKRHARGVRGTWTLAGRPNDVWTVDFKGWFRTTRGQRVEPLTVRDLHSRYLLAVEPVAATGVMPVRRVFQRLFARYGLPRAIRSDRGSPFCGSGPHGLTQLSLWWHRLGIRVEFVNRKERRDNNAHEQMHRVLQAEVGAVPQRTMRAQVHALRKWQVGYNQSRPHESLGLNTPASRYRRSQRSVRKLRWPSYPQHWLVHTVRAAGDIHINYKTYGVGRAFQRLPVGLEPLGDGKDKVYFERLLLGEINLGPNQSGRRLRLPIQTREGAWPGPSTLPILLDDSNERIQSVSEIMSDMCKRNLSECPRRRFRRTGLTVRLQGNPTRVEPPHSIDVASAAKSATPP